MPEEGTPPPAVSVPPTDVEPKMWYLSTELWSAFVALLAFVAQGLNLVEVPVPLEIQASIVTLWMFILRGFKTKSPIAWTKAQFHKLQGTA